jgi:hypothetical protein
LKRSSAPVFLVVMTLALALPATPSRAQSAAWDQDKVTELAVQLADAARELELAFRREPPPHVGHGQSRARFRFRDSLRVLRTETRALAAELEAGGGLEETWPIVRRGRVVVRDLREDGRRMGWQEPAVGHARRAEELIAQLAPFYVGAEAADAAEAGAEGAATPKPN